MASWQSDIESIGEVASLLARDRLVLKAFKGVYGPDATYFIRALRRRRWDIVEGADPDVIDVLADALGNEARLYARFVGQGPDAHDRYDIEVLGLGGVYFVRAAEFGDSELFRSLKDAVSWVELNWNTNLISPRARQYRKPFSLQSKDCAQRLPPMSSTELALARRRQSERLQQVRERQATAERAAAGPATLVSICFVEVHDDLFSTLRYELLLDEATPATEGYGLWVRDSKTSLSSITCPAGLTTWKAARQLAQEFIRGQAPDVVECTPGELLNVEDLSEIERALTGRTDDRWSRRRRGSWKPPAPEILEQTLTRWLEGGHTWLGVFENQDLDHRDFGRRVVMGTDDALYDTAIVGVTRPPEKIQGGSGRHYVLIAKVRSVTEALALLGEKPAS